MKKLLPFLLLCFLPAFGALNLMTWDGSKNTDFNDTANWTGTVAAGSTLGVGDSCLMNSGSTAATASGAVSIGFLMVTNGYSGNLSFSGQTLTTVNGNSIDGTGTLNLGNGYTQTANGTFHIGSGVGVVTATSCIVVGGDGATDTITIDDDKGATFSQLKCVGYVNNSGAAQSYYSGLLPFDSSSTGTLNSTAGNISFSVINGGLFSQGGTATIIGTGNIWIRTTGTVGIGPFNHTGASIAITILSTSTSPTLDTINQRGNISTLYNLIFYKSSTAKLVYNSNNFTLESRSSTSYSLRFGNGNATNMAIYNLGSSQVKIGNYLGTTYETGGYKINMQTSAWTVTKDITLGTKDTFDFGTSTITLNGTASHSITMTGKTGYDLVISNTATAGTTFADDQSWHTVTAQATNTQAITWSGYTMTCSGDLTLDGSGAYTIGSGSGGIIMTGATSQIHCGSTASYNGASITYNNSTAAILDDDKGITFSYIFTLGANAKVTTSGAQPTLFNRAGISFVMGGGSKFTVNKAFKVNQTLNGANLYTVNPTDTIAGDDSILFCVNNNNIKVNAPSLLYRGTGVLGFIQNQTRTNTGLNFTGSIDANTAKCIIGARNGTTNMRVNMSNSSITCGSLVLLTTAISDTISYDTSTINCAGSLTIASGLTILPSLSVFRITPAAAATATITSNGKSFNIFRVVGNATGTVTLADALTCAKLTDSTGIFNSATYTIRADTLEIFSTAATTLSSSKCVYYNKTTGVGVSITQTSTIDTAKGGTITTNGITQPKIVMAGTAVAYNGGGTLTDLVMSPAGGDTVIWQTLKKVSFSTQPTLDGIAGARNHWVCSNAAGRDTIDLPAKDTLKYFYIRNQYFVDTVLCRRSDSCFSGGGNY